LFRTRAIHIFVAAVFAGVAIHGFTTGRFTRFAGDTNGPVEDTRMIAGKTDWRPRLQTKCVG